VLEVLVAIGPNRLWPMADSLIIVYPKALLPEVVASREKTKVMSPNIRATIAGSRQRILECIPLAALKWS
jgi:hypothetical protein